MIDFANLSIFAGAVVLLLLVPGPNMAFVTSNAITHGWRAGFAAAAGITLADMIMTALVSLGVGALIMSWAPAFELLRWLGAGYLLWLGWTALKVAPVDSGAAQPLAASRGKIFLRATLNSLFNPKALLFFMVFLPQFVAPARGNVAVQMVVLGMVLAVIALLFHGALAIGAGAAHRRLKKLPVPARFASYGFAAVMVGLAARLIFLQRPQ